MCNMRNKRSPWFRDYPGELPAGIDGDSVDRRAVCYKTETLQRRLSVNQVGSRQLEHEVKELAASKYSRVCRADLIHRTSNAAKGLMAGQPVSLLFPIGTRY